MAVLLSAVSLTAPASDPAISTSGTFQMTAALTWGGGGHGGNESVTLYFEYGTVSGGPYNTIPASAGGLTTADTNPATVTASPSSITVTGATAGTYYVRARGVGTSTFSSAQQLVTVTAAPVTGSLSVTEGTSDTAALSGDVLVQGDLTKTESASDAAAFSGDVVVQGDLAPTETVSDTAAFSGTVASGVSGDLAATDATDTAAAAGAVLVAGDLAATDGADTAALAGVVLVQGDLSGADIGDTAALSGDVLVQGDLAGADTADSAALAGSVVVQGDIAATDPVDSAAFLGLGTVTGDLAATDSVDSASFRGARPIPITGGARAFVSNPQPWQPPPPIRGYMAARDISDVAAFSGGLRLKGSMRSSESADSASVKITTDMTPVYAERAAYYALLEI